ncbi:hypothetical protein ROZALSC1DRAFT_23510 [Rozella allomycis CSF55]|uniref:Uncharacterized protein n=1 Tax=Rozella allomycis (strain CSF55) TaxID=988480 RepID=A0A4P9YG31_ROZAC|nr:hypothetical protein ROZALSC1DRAFT_23510 [Rozella allomycis CSF55]
MPINELISQNFIPESPENPTIAFHLALLKLGRSMYLTGNLPHETIWKHCKINLFWKQIIYIIDFLAFGGYDVAPLFLSIISIRIEIRQDPLRVRTPLFDNYSKEVTRKSDLQSSEFCELLRDSIFELGLKELLLATHEILGYAVSNRRHSKRSASSRL